MKTVTTREAQHHLAKVLRDVEKGDDVLITRRGVPVAKISAIVGDEHPLEKTVDWNRVLEDRAACLKGLPAALHGDTVAMLREEERF